MNKLRITILSIIIVCLVLAGTAQIVTVRANGNSKEVNVIDSIVVTELHDTDKVLAEWSALDPDITVHRDFISAEAVRLFLNWSDHGGATDLQEGDYFTFVIPSIFNHSRVANATDKKITDSSGEVAATYSIYTNPQGFKEVKVTFTDFVETHTDISGISGDFWLILFVGEVGATEIKDLEIIINGEVTANGGVTINPEETPDLAHPVSIKYGYGSPANVINGHYVFEWNIFLNMEESSNGFNVLENYYFEDIIPPDSPHVFISSAIANELNILSRYQAITVKEYTGSDLEAPAKRYQTFLERYYYVGGDPWVNYLRNHTLANGVKSDGIDGQNGLNISGVKISGKSVSADLGTLTRPTVIHYYTIATIKISENSLADPETVKFFNNTFIGSGNEILDANLSEYYFESGGSAESIRGNHSIKFTKVNERGATLPGAWFSLYVSEDFSGGADRVAVSDNNGVVAFNNLAEGIYYFHETTAPEGYVRDSNIYKAVIDGKGYIIYYGANFEKRLNDQENRIVNTKEQGNNSPVPVHVALAGTKILSGKTLEDGMFTFAVKDADGNTVCIGTNNADGKITFNALEYTIEGVYVYTVVEVHGNEAGIDYSDTVYTVRITVTATDDGTLAAAVVYPDGDILFRNAYTETNTPGGEIPGTTIPGTTIPERQYRKRGYRKLKSPRWKYRWQKYQKKIQGPAMISMPESVLSCWRRQPVLLQSYWRLTLKFRNKI